METLADKDTFSGNLTVSELTKHLKRLIEGNVPVVSVVGELSNYVHHTSGHRYFTLKDESSQLRCVMFKWQAARVDFTPEEGMSLNAVGNVTVYERGGQYQLNVVRLVPMGRGELLLRLEELKKKLAEEGIFDNERPIPAYPAVIGVATSPTGAAVRDIISVISRRAPNVKIILRPATVQGEDAPLDIVGGIRDLNEATDADVLIVGRGGGSIEDLWCFNDERVARAIAASGKPVISAVGHETDFTLADFAADLRAPTPSAAAELVVKDMSELRQNIAKYAVMLKRGVMKNIDDIALRLEHARRGLSPERFQQMLVIKSQHVDELAMRIRNTAGRMIAEKEKTVGSLESKLLALNPAAVLERGYSIVYRDADSGVVDDYRKVEKNDGIFIVLAKGRLRAKVGDKYE